MTLLSAPSRHGTGVFTDSPIPANVHVLDFGGARMTRAEVDAVWSSDDDHYLQLGPDFYLGPSGEMDDLVNHSCDPNCAVTRDGDRASLTSVRHISAGEELTFDYSTTSDEDLSSWSMGCRCGASSCRKLISGQLR